MESSSEVNDAYRALLQALSGGDAAAFLARISQQSGALLVGSASEEWFAGPAAIGEMATGMLPMLQHAGLTFEPGDPQAFREGSVGWVADRLIVRARSGQGQELRATAVFHQEDGQWRLVQYAHSLGVPDDQVEIFRALGG